MNFKNLLGDDQIPFWDKFCSDANFRLTAKEIFYNKKYMNLLKGNLFELIHIYCLWDAYRNGPKCIKPTLTQCIAFEQIDPNIDLEEYNQIYPTVIIEVPEEYKSVLMAHYKYRAPRYIIMHWDAGIKVLLITVSFGKRNPVTTFYIVGKHEETLCGAIEGSLSKDSGDIEYNIACHVIKMAINLNLFMVNFGHEKRGYENVKQHRHFERKKQQEAKFDVEYYSLKQDIKLYERRMYKSNGDGSHASPSPHWRKGHYRYQRYGVGYSLKRMIFIKPVFVCPEKFVGILSDTEVNYVK